MKSLFVAATALALSGSALAYQNPDMDVDVDATATTSVTEPGVSVSLDPTVAITPPASWTPDQVALYEEHLAFFPSTWTAEERAAFAAMRAMPPASWTVEQRTLYEQHLAALPTTWTAEQRATYEMQIASMRTPWLSVDTASTGVSGTTTTTTTAQADYRNFAGMGGPYEEVYGSGTVSLTPRPATENYPPCDPGPGDDNCIQLYEPGVRDQLASWNRATGGLADGSATTAMGGPYEAAGPDPASKPVTQPSTTTDTTSPSSTSGTPSTASTHSGHDMSADKPAADPTGTTEDDTTEPDQ